MERPRMKVQVDRMPMNVRKPKTATLTSLTTVNTINNNITNRQLAKPMKKRPSTTVANKKEIKKNRRVKEVKNEARLRALSSPDYMWNLRMKFLDQLRKYFGVPYAKRYWKPDEPEYSEKIFLDCCGLIRRTLKDLQKDFGFRIGPWNQCYMYDTLPIPLEEKDMKPGDLVFISATYFNQKMRKQAHNMTHVEVWLGDGPKTIGSRWHRGKVQIFDSYAFEAKSYHSETYHFKSIDTWLMGICRSHCKEHTWKTRAERFTPGKKSVFSNHKQQPKKQQPDAANEDEESDEAASDTDIDEHAGDSSRGKSAPQAHQQQQHVRLRLKHRDQSRVTVSSLSTKSSPAGVTILEDSDENDDNNYDDDADDDFLRSTPDTSSLVSRDEETSSSGLRSSASATPTNTSISDVSSLRDKECEHVTDIGGTDCSYNTQQYPNEQRDFAMKSTNPREGKQTDLSEQNQRKQNPKRKCVSSNKKDGDSTMIWNQEREKWVLKSDRGGGANSSNSDESSSNASSDGLNNSRKDTSKMLDIDCQTGMSNEGKCFHILGEDKWVGAKNVLCYASMCRGEASVQIKSPDLIPASSSSSSGFSDSEEGYSAQEQSISDDIDNVITSDKKNQSASNNSITSKHFSNLPNSVNKRQRAANDKVSSSNDDDQDNNDDNGDDDIESLGAFSMYPRVGSAASMRSSSLHPPEAVGPLYTGMTPESSSNTDATQSDGATGRQQENKGNRITNNNNSLDSTSPRSEQSDAMGDNTNRSSKEDKKDMNSGRKSRRVTDENRQSTEGGKRSRFSALAQPNKPTFYIAGGNGVALVESSLSELGWKRITNKYDDTFKLKWVECKTTVNYNLFRQGDQLVNRIPNCSVLTNKLGLLNSLQRYERISNTLGNNAEKLKSSDFLPETYRIDDNSERQMFFETFQDGETWICKPCGLNQGKGIYLTRNLEDFKKTLEERDEKNAKNQSHRPMERIIQKYISQPLLLSQRKFDIRCYMLIASTTPYLVCYHKGYVRLCLYSYKLDSDNLIGHLTNQFIQKKDDNYKEYKEETVWSMDKFNQYINENIAPNKDLEQDWVYTTLTNKIKQIMQYCFQSVKHKLKLRLGYFDLYGFDFMVDEDMKVWLIEINANPCLATNCQSLLEIVPGVVRESLYLAIECFEKTKKGQPIHPLNCLTNFEIIYDGNASGRSRGRPSSPVRGPLTSRTRSPKQRSQSPTNRKQTASPYKDPLSNVLSQSTPGPIQSGGSLSSALITQSLIKTDEYFKGASKIYATALTRTVTPRVSSGLVKTAPKGVINLSPNTIGLRGALPLSAKNTSVASSEGCENNDIFKFKMTHAALMSSVRSERAKSAAAVAAAAKRGLTGSTVKDVEVSGKTTKETDLTSSRIMQEDEAQEEPELTTATNLVGSPTKFDKATAKAIEQAQSNLDVYLQRLISPSPMIKESDGAVIDAAFKTAHSPPKKGSPTNCPSPTRGVQIQDISKTNNTGSFSPFANTSAPSIPTLKKEAKSNDGGGIVGVSIKKNERGS